MREDLSWMVGGQQGEGIDSTGEIFASALNKLGYYLYGHRHFSSRIKGGHTNNKIRVSTKSLRSISDDLQILVAFDQETIDLNAVGLSEDGVIIADSKFKPTLPENVHGTLIPIPFTDIAREKGNVLMKNMVAVGSSASLLNLPTDIFKNMITELFSKKGNAIVENNINAFIDGFNFIDNEQIELAKFELAKNEINERLFMIGNDAIAFGALSAGARLMPAYPITPASEIMEYLIKKLPQFGGTVVQTEDEIAAVTMAIGASYSGVRSLTASSGPGLSLMTEAIGLSGITETPLVIVDTQRGGPSTGLPTKQEQSDINALINGTHGEIPKIVMAPATVEDCFYDTVQAFNLADKYQVPVIIASDLSLSLGKQSAEPFDFGKVKIDRGNLITDEITEEHDSEYFKRYALTNNNISPRPIPGVKGGIHHVTGVEHNEEGRPSEDKLNRVNMMNKRLNKLNDLTVDSAYHEDCNHEEPDILLVGMGSTIGVIQETKERLESENLKINHLQIKLLHPFPIKDLKNCFDSAKKIIIIEHNATGQLTNIINQNLDDKSIVQNILKYDGNPFLPKELHQKIKELV